MNWTQLIYSQRNVLAASARLICSVCTLACVECNSLVSLLNSWDVTKICNLKRENSYCTREIIRLHYLCILQYEYLVNNGLFCLDNQIAIFRKELLWWWLHFCHVYATFQFTLEEKRSIPDACHCSCLADYIRNCCWTSLLLISPD